MGCYWFLSTLVLDLTLVTIEADVVVRLYHILLLASPSLNEVDDITRQVAVAHTWKGWPVEVLTNVSLERM